MSCVTSTTVAPLRADPSELVEALLLEGRVPDGEDLVDEQDVGVDLDHHGERQPDEHAGRVVLDLQLGEVVELGEVDDPVVASLGLPAGQAQHGGVDHHVVVRREIGVEADAEFDERGEPSVHVDLARVCRVDAGEAFQQRRLAAAVATDDAVELAALYAEGDAAQAVHRVDDRPPERVQRPLLERVDALPRDAEVLRDTIDDQRRRFGHPKSVTSKLARSGGRRTCRLPQWRRMRRIRSFTVTPQQYRLVAYAALIVCTMIVFTGAAVRVTGSGLGCPDWPRCEGTSLTPELSSHALIEFGNRLLTGVVGLPCLARGDPRLAPAPVPPRHRARRPAAPARRGGAGRARRAHGHLRARPELGHRPLPAVDAAAHRLRRPGLEGALRAGDPAARRRQAHALGDPRARRASAASRSPRGRSRRPPARTRAATARATSCRGSTSAGRTRSTGRSTSTVRWPRCSGSPRSASGSSPAPAASPS